MSFPGVLTGRTCRKGACNNPREYAYGAINHYLTKSYPGKLPITLADEFIKLGKTFSERVTRFLSYEQAYLKCLWGKT